MKADRDKVQYYMARDIQNTSRGPTRIRTYNGILTSSVGLLCIPILEWIKYLDLLHCHHVMPTLHVEGIPVRTITYKELIIMVTTPAQLAVQSLEESHVGPIRLIHLHRRSSDI